MTAVTAVAVMVLGSATLWLYGICKGLLGLRRLVDRSWEQVDDELRLSSRPTQARIATPFHCEYPT